MTWIFNWLRRSTRIFLQPKIQTSRIEDAYMVKRKQNLKEIGVSNVLTFLSVARYVIPACGLLEYFVFLVVMVVMLLI